MMLLLQKLSLVMKLANIIKLGVAASALLLLPRRSSPKADKIANPIEDLQHPKGLEAKVARQEK